MSRPRVQSLIKLTYWTFSVGSLQRVCTLFEGDRILCSVNGHMAILQQLNLFTPPSPLQARSKTVFKFSREFRGKVALKSEFTRSKPLNSRENSFACGMSSVYQQVETDGFRRTKVAATSCHPPVTLCHPQTGCKPLVASLLKKSNMLI